MALVGPGLSAILISKNAGKTIRDTLSSLDFCDELIVFDSGSDDDTVAIARSYGAIVFETDWPGFGVQKQRALSAVSNPWVLSIDCDEVVSDSLRSEICQTLANPQFDVYRMPLINHLCRRPVLCAGWYPDYHDRLFRVDAAAFSEAPVHESLIYCCAHGTLRSPLFHYTYDSLETAIDKLNRYSSLGASQLKLRRKNSGSGISRWTPVFRFWFRLVYVYLFRSGWRGGFDGFTVSLLQAVEVYFKYLKALN
jgi:glycosyltransferase involved in cell wall biosynthesis